LDIGKVSFPRSELPLVSKKYSQAIIGKIGQTNHGTASLQKNYRQLVSNSESRYFEEIRKGFISFKEN